MKGSHCSRRVQNLQQLAWGSTCAWRSSTHDHLGLGVHGIFKLLEVDGPFGRRGCSGGTVLGWVKWHITDSTAGHLDVANIPVHGISHPVFSQGQIFLLVKERLKDDNFIAGFNETHKSTEHALDIWSAPNPTCCTCYPSPSFAPVVIETSVSGLIFLPKKGEYASAMACLRRGRPYIL